MVTSSAKPTSAHDDLFVANMSESAAVFFREHQSVILWALLYTFGKLLARVIYAIRRRFVWGSIPRRIAQAFSWDFVCLLHNAFSVVVGIWTIWFWDTKEDIFFGDNPYAASNCGNYAIHTKFKNCLSSKEAFVIMLQAVHCVSDFIIYLPEMIADPTFIFHHGILLVASLILPHCPGCAYVVVAFTLAEFGSLSIAVDTEWRKTGGKSRGLTRVVLFGGTRLLNLFLLYKLYQVTPSATYFTVAYDNVDLFQMNVPICMITSVGSSAMMLCVNGVTFVKMFQRYLKLRKKRFGKGKEKSSRTGEGNGDGVPTAPSEKEKSEQKKQK